MTPNILAAAQEGLRLAENATKGPWVKLPEPYAAGIKSSLGTLICALGPTATKDEFLANRDLIAHCGTHHADICRELLVAEQKLRDIYREATGACSVSYEYDPTPTAEERLARIAALAQTGEEKKT